MNARGLAVRIREEVPRIEAERRLSDSVAEALAEAGCHRWFAPEWVASTAVELSDVLAIIEELSRVDASVGWCASQFALGQIIFGYLPRATLEAVYGGSPDLRVAGVFAPKGRARRVEDAWE